MDFHRTKDSSLIAQKGLNKVAAGAAITFSSMALGGGLQYIYHIVLARYLGSESLGLFVLGLTTVSIATAFARMGLDNGILRFVSIYRGVGDNARVRGIVIQALVFAVISSIIVGILLFISSKGIAAIFKEPDLISIISFLTISIPFFTLMTLALAVCQAFHIAKYTALVQNLLLPSFNILLVTIFFYLGWMIAGVVAAYIISTFLAFIIALYFLSKVSYLLIGAKKGVYETKELLWYSFPLLIVSILDYVIVWTDTIMLGLFRTSSEVGVYSVAVKTSMLLVLILVSLNFLFAPLISDLYNRKELGELEYMFKTITRWSFTIGLPVFLIMILWRKQIIGVFGSEFVLAMTPLLILSVGQLFNLTTGPVGTMLLMTGRTGFTLFNSIIIFITNFVLNLLLIPEYGMIGAAIATTFSLVFFNLLRLFEVFFLMRIHPYSFNFIKPVVAGVFSTIPVFVFTLKVDLNEFVELVIALFTVMVLYMTFLWFLGFERDDKKLFMDFKTRFMIG